MKKVAIFQTDLHVGGIQRSLINILENINDVDIDLYLFDKSNFFNIDKITKSENINIKYLDKLPKISKYLPFKILNKLYKNNYFIDKNYDLAIDFNSYSNETAIATLNTSSKDKVCFIHSDLEKKYQYENRYKISSILSKSKFKLYQKFVFVSKGIVSSFYNIYPFANKNYQVIPNLIIVDDVIEKSREKINLKIDQNKYNLIGVGRFAKVKGMDLLIDNFHKIKQKRDDIHLYIVGDGEEKFNIISKINKYNLNDSITLLGEKSNPYNIMNLMDGFITMSRYEGQGIVGLEAKTLGLDIFMPSHLQKYCPNIKASNDIIDSVTKAKKNKKKQYDYLKDYNESIKRELKILLN